MFEEIASGSLQCPWERYLWNLSDHFGQASQQFAQKELPWKCSDCSQIFKWGMQLLRHERKTGHNHKNRQIRRERRYKKVLNKTIKCSLCSLQFQEPLKRLEHTRWCEYDDRTLKTRELYQSSFQKFPYQCYFHYEPHYFSSLQKLQTHIKTHKKFDKRKIDMIKDVFSWKKKWKWAGLTNQQYDYLRSKYEIQISLSALRKMFKKV